MEEVEAMSNEQRAMSNDSGERDYRIEGQQNLMKVIEYLSLDVFNPKMIKEVMAGLNLTKSKVFWTLKNLEAGGWAEQAAEGWRLSPTIVKIARSVEQNFREKLGRYLT